MVKELWYFPIRNNMKVHL